MSKDKTASDVSKLIKDNNVKLIDFKFTDLPGTWQHFTTTLSEYNEEIFTEGLGFDGSSIRGWKVINASDMLVIPDPNTAWIDIFNVEPTLSLICTIVDPITREPYDRDPRGVAEKAEAYLKSTGIADTAFFGPEAEFFIFDDVRFSYATNSSFHLIDSVEGHWNSAREEFPNVGYKIRAKEGYFPVPPMDTLQDIRNEMSLELEKAGIPIDKQHHEVATAGQAEIDVRFAPLKEMGDSMQYYKYIIRNVARKHNKTVTFMPKPLFADNGSGMHTHMSLWKDGKPLFAGLDGTQNRIDPGDPLDKNLYELPPEELAQVASVPDSLRGAIEALQADHSFLLRGDVFNADFIANWVDMKQKEYDALRLRPHPYEFSMYYDV